VNHSKRTIPNLDEYLGENRHRYAKYYEGSRQYGMNYYQFIKLVKEAGAGILIRKSILVDLDVLDEYIKKYKEEDGNANEEKSDD